MSKAIPIGIWFKQVSPRKRASRENGGRGGEVRAAKYEPSTLSQWASKGGKTLLEKYGREYFVELRKLRPTKAQAAQAEADEAETDLRWRKYHRSIAARENGRKGGFKRAQLFFPACRQAMAREGGTATKNRYGSEFFKEIRKKRKHYPKGYMTKKTKQRLRAEYIQKAKTDPLGVRHMWLALARKYES